MGQKILASIIAGISSIVASIISSFNGILLGIIGYIVAILKVFTGTNSSNSLFQNVLKTASSGGYNNTSITSLATTIFVAVIAVNIFQETIRYFTETDVGLDRVGIVKVIRESMGVVAFLTVYSLLFSSSETGWKAISAISGVASTVSKTAASSLINTLVNTATATEVTGLLPNSGVALEFIIMLMAFGLIMGMINCIAQLVGTFIVGLVGIIIGIMVLPIHISLTMLGRGNNAGRALITIINAIVLIGVILGLGQAIVAGQMAGDFTPNMAISTDMWKQNVLKYLVYFGLLEGYKALVQRANGTMTDLLANIFQLG